jgi:hypothetical protein
MGRRGDDVTQDVESGIRNDGQSYSEAQSSVVVLVCYFILFTGISASAGVLMGYYPLLGVIFLLFWLSCIGWVLFVVGINGARSGNRDGGGGGGYPMHPVLVIIL